MGDVAYVGRHRPTVTMAYKNEDNNFAEPLGFDLVQNITLFMSNICTTLRTSVHNSVRTAESTDSVFMWSCCRPRSFA